MKVKVFRYSADTGDSSLSSYDLPFGPERRYTVLTIIRYIHDNLDPTLSFFNHCACSRGICGQCLMEVNGVLTLACNCVPGDDEITLRPKNSDYMKDLVCRR